MPPCQTGPGLAWPSAGNAIAISKIDKRAKVTFFIVAYLLCRIFLGGRPPSSLGSKQHRIFGALIHLVPDLSIKLKISNDHTNNSYSGGKAKADQSCVLTLCYNVVLATYFFLAFVVLSPLRIRWLSALSDSKSHPQQHSLLHIKV